MLASFAAVGSTLLMLHFLRRMWSNSHEADMQGALTPWLATAFAAIVLPWVLYLGVANASLRDAFAVKEIWEALWPVLLGALASLALWRWGHVLPRIPAGDLLEADTGPLRAARGLGAAMEQIDKYVRQWTVASALLVALIIILCVGSLVGR